MTDYQIQPLTRRCVATGRELKPGERFYTALLDQNGQFIRQDFCAEAWQGPPPGTFSYWVGKVTAPQDRVKPRFDDDLLEECFQRLEGQTEPSKVNFRYVLALLLVRRKRLKFDHAVAQGPVEMIQLTGLRTGEKHQVVNPRLAEDAMVEVQEEVFKVLGWN